MLFSNYCLYTGHKVELHYGAEIYYTAAEGDQSVQVECVCVTSVNQSEVAPVNRGCCISARQLSESVHLFSETPRDLFRIHSFRFFSN